MQLQLSGTFPHQPGNAVLEQAMRPANLLKAYERVKRNGGAPGIDGETVEQFGTRLNYLLTFAREQVLAGNYLPQPVRRVAIPKPGGGERHLGIPTILDRVLQQALLQALIPVFDPQFHQWNFGFRTGFGAHPAILQAQQHIRDGHRWVVDLDLEKFFDRVNHDVLMSRIARRVTDKGALRLIRRYLQAGVMEGGVASLSTEGTPQGGPLSPLLSNILLDELDQELGQRGHRFCRYADDCNVYVRSRAAGRRVMASLTRFLEKRLRLTVNQKKSAVDRPWNRQFLGYTVTFHKRAKLQVAPDREKRLKDKLKPFLRMARGRAIDRTLSELAPKIRGWASYYKLCDVKGPFERLDLWLRRRIRLLFWRQWKTPKNRFRQMARRGVPGGIARAGSRDKRGPYWHSGSSHMLRAINYKELRELGWLSFLEEFQRLKRSAGNTRRG